MKHENNWLFRTLEITTAFVQLNVLWLICSLPLVTCFPATVAMYCVIRQWQLHDDYSVVRPFFHFFKENWRPNMWLGFGWFVVACLLGVDLLIASQFTEWQAPFFIGFVVIAILFVLTSVYLFPLIAHFEMANWTVLRSAFFFSFRFLPTTIAALLVMALATMVAYYWPLATFVVAAATAFVVTWLCQRLFRQLAHQ